MKIMMDGPRDDLHGFNKMSEVLVSTLIQNSLLSLVFLLLFVFIESYLPTLPVFPGVSKFFIKSPGLPVRAPNLPDKMDF